MVDPIGIKTGTVANSRSVAVVATQAAAAPKAVRGDARPVESEAAVLSSTMAASAPVDSERVARIKKAIEQGRFPLIPSTVADRLLALKMEWDPSGEAK